MLLKGWGKSHKNLKMVGIRTEVRTPHNWNAGPKRSRLRKLVPYQPFWEANSYIASQVLCHNLYDSRGCVHNTSPWPCYFPLAASSKISLPYRLSDPDFEGISYLPILITITVHWVFSLLSPYYHQWGEVCKLYRFDFCDYILEYQ